MHNPPKTLHIPAVPLTVTTLLPKFAAYRTLHARTTEAEYSERSCIFQESYGPFYPALKKQLLGER